MPELTLFQKDSAVSRLGNPNLIGFLTPEDGTDRLSRNVGEELPLYAV